MADTVFFDGGVTDAIRSSNAEKRPLVVFLKGTDSTSQEVKEALLSERFEALVKDCLVLLLEDDLEDAESEQYTNGRNFRQFFPVTELPAVFMLAVNGSALVSVKGTIAVDELFDKLTAGLSVYKIGLSQNTEQSTTPNGVQPPSAPDARRDAQSSHAPPSTSTEKKKTAAVPKQDVGIPPKTEPVVVKRRKKKAPEPKLEPPVYTTALLRVRLTNDDFIENEFSADATLREVCSFIDVHRTDGGAPYVLEMMYPRKELGEDKYTATLKELDLVPRSTVRLMPKASGSGNPSGMSENDGGMISYVNSAIGSVVGYIGSFFSTPSATPDDSRATDVVEDIADRSDPSEIIPDQEHSSTSVSRHEHCVAIDIICGT